MIEAIGYLASGLIVISFLIPNDVKKMRIVNMLGAICFVVYGGFIENLPIIIPNVFIILVQIYYLWIYKPKS